MLWLVILVLVVLLVFGGIGYGNRDTWGNYYGGGLGILGVIFVILLILFLLGVIK